MRWLAAHLKHVIMALILIGTVAGWASAAKYKGIADTLAKDAERQTVLIAEQSARALVAEMRVSRVLEETTQQRAVDSVSIASLTDSVSTIDARGDSLEAVAQAEAVELGGMIPIATHDVVVTSLTRRVEVADSLTAVEHAGKLQERERGDALAVHVSELTAQIGLLERRDTTRVAEIEALRSISSAPSIGMRIKADWWLAAGGFLVGMVATR